MTRIIFSQHFPRSFSCGPAQLQGRAVRLPPLWQEEDTQMRLSTRPLWQSSFHFIPLCMLCYLLLRYPFILFWGWQAATRSPAEAVWWHILALHFIISLSTLLGRAEGQGAANESCQISVFCPRISYWVLLCMGWWRLVGTLLLSVLPFGNWGAIYVIF